ncbi:MAG TPA: hypothetical protein VN031_03555 [Candidatus Microsaccharimonas sp.]|nr:hypothetical protein [Candidatus Microsaccharimonas sp.]
MINPDILQAPDNFNPEAVALEAGRLATDALLRADNPDEPVEREDIVDGLQEEFAEAGILVVDLRAQSEEEADAPRGVVTGRTREAVIADRLAPSRVRRRRIIGAIHRTRG